MGAEPQEWETPQMKGMHPDGELRAMQMQCGGGMGEERRMGDARWLPCSRERASSERER